MPLGFPVAGSTHREAWPGKRLSVSDGAGSFGSPSNVVYVLAIMRMPAHPDSSKAKLGSERPTQPHTGGVKPGGIAQQVRWATRAHRMETRI
jgi:hypothetical protein